MIDGVKLETINWDEPKSEKAAQVVGQEVIELKEGGKTLVFEIEAKRLLCDDKDFFKVAARQLGGFPRSKYYNLGNVVQVTVCETLGVAKFGPKGNIQMAPRGIGLGSYLMSRAIKWLQTHYPDVEIAPGALAPLQDQDDKERERRNRFYESHGFDVVYNDGEHKGESFYKDHAKHLRAKKLPESKNLEDVVESNAKQRIEIEKLTKA